VRVERPAAHTFVPRLVEAFPGAFRSVTLGAPSLEDVFITRTGRRFREADTAESGIGTS
jgi:ABC-2 type transport system ATP-binding protein